MKHQSKIILAALIIGLSVGAPFLAEAAGLLPACATGSGRCHLNDIVQTFLNFARLLLGFVGSAVLVFFIYGGFVWVTSGGSTDRIQKGKGIVTNAIIGLIIVFGAFTIVQFIFDSLDVSEEVMVGQACEGGGIYVNDTDGTLQCVTSCEDDLMPDDYECMDLNVRQGKNCVYGLCPGGNNVVCCQPDI